MFPSSTTKYDQPLDTYHRATYTISGTLSTTQQAKSDPDEDGKNLSCVKNEEEEPSSSTQVFTCSKCMNRIPCDCSTEDDPPPPPRQTVIMFHNYYVTDFACPPSHAELNEDEKRELSVNKGQKDVVWNAFQENAYRATRNSFRMHGSMPFCPVDALDDGSSLQQATQVVAKEIKLAIFNAPNHGTYQMCAQSYGRKRLHSEFGAYAFKQLAKAAPHASIMALNPFDADCPRLSDCSLISDRLLCVTKACAGIYEPLNSSRTLVTPRSTEHGLRCTMLLLPEHFPWMIACRTLDGAFDALKFVFAFLHNEQKVVSYGCYVMNFEMALIRRSQEEEVV